MRKGSLAGPGAQRGCPVGWEGRSPGAAQSCAAWPAQQRCPGPSSGARGNHTWHCRVRGSCCYTHTRARGLSLDRAGTIQALLTPPGATWKAGVHCSCAEDHTQHRRGLKKTETCLCVRAHRANCGEMPRLKGRAAGRGGELPPKGR